MALRTHRVELTLQALWCAISVSTGHTASPATPWIQDLDGRVIRPRLSARRSGIHDSVAKVAVKGVPDPGRDAAFSRAIEEIGQKAHAFAVLGATSRYEVSDKSVGAGASAAWRAKRR